MLRALTLRRLVCWARYKFCWELYNSCTGTYNYTESYTSAIYTVTICIVVQELYMAFHDMLGSIYFLDALGACPTAMRGALLQRQ